MVTLSGGSSAIPAPAPEINSLTPRKPRAPRHRSFWGELWRWGVTAIWFSIIAALVASAQNTFAFALPAIAVRVAVHLRADA